MTNAKRRDADRIAHLEAEIRRHRGLYYGGTPEISDLEFDRLEDELRDLAPESPVLGEIGAAPEGAGLPRKTHKIPMGSLEKITEDKLDAWTGKMGPLFLVQEKLDGISLELEYENGELVDAITRGDGIVGEVVTHNAVYFKNVRTRIGTSFTGSVRGEVILRLSDFERHFVGRDFANPRNTVSGTVRKKHGDRSLNRHFEMRYFDVVIGEAGDAEQPFATEREKMHYLEKELGFSLAKTYVDCEVDEIRSIYTRYQGEEGRAGERFKLDYEIDGLVVRENELAKQRELGSRGNRPRFAMAYKFPSEGRETILREVDWSLGLTARVTPVARLEPVEIAGVTVSNASLHNADYVRGLDVRLGDVVLVERKGDVIPKVMRVVRSQGTKRPKIPKKCPTCRAELEFVGKHLICPNAECSGKAYGDIFKWIQELEIDALGEKWVQILIERGLVTEPADLYRLRAEDLTPLERMGETLAAKFVSNIQATRKPPLARFIAALNIPEFSRQRAQMLIDAEYDTLAKMVAASPEDLASVKGFAEILAEKAAEGLAGRAERISRLRAVGVEPQKGEPTPISTDGPFAGMSFCFTGAIQRENPETGKRYTRKEMQDLVKQLGGTAAASVSRGLTYLVLVDQNSTTSKAKKARDLDVGLLSEEEFFGKVEAAAD